MRQVKFKDLPVEDYDKFRMECERIKEEGPFMLVLVDADLTNTKNPEFKHIKYSMLPAIYADKVVYKNKILLKTSGPSQTKPRKDTLTTKISSSFFK